MKVLFLSVTAGQGHNQTAKAAMGYMVEQGIQCTMLDTFDYINPILCDSITKGYLISTKLTPSVYGRMYRMAERMEHSNAKLSVNRLTSSVLSKKLEKYIREYDPDAIIATHIFAAQILSNIKQKGLRAKTLGIVTDYTIHPFWEEPDLDYFVTASELLTRQALKKGIPAERILPIGIPIHPKFSKRICEKDARERLGIDNRDTVLVMSGSMGYGNVAAVLKQLDKLDIDFQILSVCGSNTALRKKIGTLDLKTKVHNYGFVDNVDVMMDAANAILTKPGGLTVSESLAKGLPMALMSPIPGQEERNVEFLMNNGLALRISKTFPADEAVYQLLLDPARTRAMVDRILQIAKPNATRDLYRHISASFGYFSGGKI